jgi:hypothetical protein
MRILKSLLLHLFVSDQKNENFSEKVRCSRDRWGVESMFKRVRKKIIKLQSILLKKKIDSSLVIVRFDGGISSQIAFWCLCLEFEQKGQKVKADLSWYENDGKDMFGDQVRNFDLLKAFPSARLDFSRPYEAYYYKTRYRISEEVFNMEIKGPAYLGGYYDRWNLFKKHAQHITSQFQPELPASEQFNRLLIDIIEAPHSCAVHARRGDLAVFNPYYGEPLTTEYFFSAVQNVSSLNPNTKFFFFSDDQVWVQRELLVPLGGDVDCVLVDINDSSRGYLDLYMMSKCGSFIASQGSLAKYARLLGDPSRTIIEPSSARLFDDLDSHPSICL